MSDNNDYNVYNTFDSNFINYGELYKTPREMKSNTKDLIGDYADALIKGSSEVYENSPDLVGNRYFIDTNTLCLDSDDNTKIHNRSVLVDNVLTSTIDMAKDGNRGLMYSLLGSLKTMNTNTMYDMSNNEPISYDKKNPTEYLNNINEKPMPLCSKVSVYAGDDKDSGIISGYVTKDDMDIIDPKAKENTVEGMVGAPPITVNGNMTAKEFGSGIDKQQKVITAHQEAIASAQTTATNEATSKAQGALNNAKNSAKQHGSNASSSLKSATSSSIKTQKGRAESAKAAGASNQLIKATNIYLSTPPPSGALGLKCGDTSSTLGIVSTLLNVKYPCGSEKRMRRIPYQCIDEIGKRFKNMSHQESKDFKKYGNNICSNKDKFKNGYSVPKFFQGLSRLLKENAYNDTAELNTSDIPNSPPMSIDVRVFVTVPAASFLGKSRTVGKCEQKTSLDYESLYGELDKTCLKEFATLITRYNDVSAFGNCSGIKSDDDDNFIDKMYVPCTSKTSITFLDSTAYFYIITLFFLILYMIYKFMLKIFHFDKLMPMTPKKNKK